MKKLTIAATGVLLTSFLTGCVYDAPDRADVNYETDDNLSRNEYDFSNHTSASGYVGSG